jgi:amino acid adenylation domain-containing protein
MSDDTSNDVTLFPVLPLQRRLWWLHHLDGPDPAYVLAAGLWIDGPLIADALDRAVRMWVQRHEGLRTCFLPQGGVPHQVVHDAVPSPLTWHDLREVHAPEDRALDAFHSANRQAFALENAPLVRLDAYRVRDDQTLLGIAVDHAIADAASVAVLGDDLAQLYAHAAGLGPVPPEPGLQPGDVAEWLACNPDLLSDPACVTKRVTELAKKTAIIPFASTAPALADTQVGWHERRIPPGQAEALRQVARELGCTEATLWLGLWAAVLEAATPALQDQQNRVPAIILAVPVDIRFHPDLAHVAAPLIDTGLVVIDRPAGMATLEHWIADAARAMAHMLACQPAPLDEIVAGLRLPRRGAEQGPTPLAFAWTDRQTAMAWPGLSVRQVAARPTAAKFDLMLSATCDTDGSIGLQVEHALARVDTDLASGLLHALVMAAQQVPEDRQAPLPRAMPAAAKASPADTIRQAWTEVLPQSAARDDSDFFRDGGHSLLIAKLSLKLSRVLRRRVPARLILENPVLGALISAIAAGDDTVQPRARTVESHVSNIESRTSKTDPRASTTDPRASTTPAPQQPVARPLTDTQARIWLQDRLHPDSPAYVISGAVRIKTALDIDLLRAALDGVVARHPMLGARVELHEGQPRQWLFEPPVGVALTLEDLSTLPANRRGAVLRAHLERLAATPFDLSNPPLIRARLFRMSADDHVIALSVHHLAADGTSLALVLEELSSSYAAMAAGRTIDLPASPDPLLWLDHPADPGAEARSRAYWAKTLRDPPLLHLPTDAVATQEDDWRAGVHAWSVTPDKTAALRALAQSEGATLFMALLSIWAVFLGRYSDEDEVIVGVPVDFRDHPERAHLVGCLVQVVPVRLSVGGEISVRAMLRQVRQAVSDALTHSEIGLQQILQAANLTGQNDEAPLISTLFAYQTLASEHALRDFEAVPVHAAAAQVDLSLHLDGDPQGGLSGTLVWRKVLYHSGTVNRMTWHLDRLIDAVLETPDVDVQKLPFTSTEELRRYAYWNDTGQSYEGPATVSGLIDTQALATPDQVALIDGDRRWSFAQTHAEIVRVASGLAAAGVQPRQVVAIAIPRSAELTIALAAVVRAGAVALPIHTDVPAARVAQMLEDAQPVLAVCLGARPATLGPEIACLDIETLAGDPAQMPDEVTPDDPAYVLFTSGSTGRPKGVQVSHRALVNRLAWMQDFFPLGAGDRVLQKTPVSFDVSMWEFFWSLTHGGTLVMAPPDLHRDPRGLAQMIEQANITHLHFVPRMLAAFLDVSPQDALSGVRHVFVSGEALTPALTDRFFEASRSTALHNLYGPTEAAIDVTWWSCKPSDSAGPVPIGAPAPNCQIHIVDRWGAQVPIGVPGEVLIGGVQLADGYVNRADLTDAHFVPDTVKSEPGARLYRTGDKGRWRVDGVVEYLGRADGQIKLRGQRIELAEIEAVLEQHPGVQRAAVVIAGDGADARLCAFVVARGNDTGAPPALGILRLHAAAHLPPAMLPARYEFLDALPVTENGKLDRRVLRSTPRADDAGDASAVQGRRPAPGAEAAIARAWGAVLGHEEFSVDDGFFEVGGTSLSLVAVETRLRQHWPDIKLADLFRYPNVAALAAALAQDTAGTMAAPIALRGTTAPTTEVAITAVVGRFPGAPDVAALWEMLLAGAVGYRATTDTDRTAVPHPQTWAKGVFEVPVICRPDGTDLFDPESFGLRPTDALTLDPQMRMLLELSWQALDQAGLDPAALAGGVSVFAGTGLPIYGLSNLFADAALGATDPSAAYAQLIAADKDFAPGRIAHLLDLRGPAVAVQTACSTGLVAVHLAADAIRRGDCEAALAGGATLSLPATGYPWQEGGILSRSGACRAFAQSADGTVPGEGGAMVVLRRLDAALRDGDPVLGVLLGSAINNDGADRSAFTAPSISGQSEVIRSALARAGVAPTDIGYVEAHGTGTQLGDLVETTALADVFDADQGADTPTRVLGAIKASIGHLDTAAGTAGLIKAVLAVRHSVVPGTPGLDVVNPALSLERAGFVAGDALMPWPAGYKRRVAGVSAFGIGGTNAHAVVAEAPARPGPLPVANAGITQPQLLLLSAPDLAGLRRWATDLAAALRAGADLEQLCWTLQSGRRRHKIRRAIVANSGAEAAEALLALAADDTHPALIPAPPPVGAEAGLAYLLPGHGVISPGMLAGLDEGLAPVAHATVQALLAPLPEEIATQYSRLLFEPPRSAAAQALGQSGVAQPIQFIASLAIARQLAAWGHPARTLVGHGLGDWTGAVLAGLLDASVALDALSRSGAALDTAAPGVMLSVGLSAAELSARLQAPLEGDLVLAEDNGDDSSVVAGATDAVALLEAALKADGIPCHRLPGRETIQTAATADIGDTLQRHIRSLKLAAPQVRFVPGTLGRVATPDDISDGSFLAENFGAPVRFREALSHLPIPVPILIEVGQGSRLQSLCADRFAQACCLGTLPAATEDMPATTALMRTLGALWLTQRESDWTALHGARMPDKLVLPDYPFDRRRFWKMPDPAQAALSSPQTVAGPETASPAWQRMQVAQTGGGPPSVALLDYDGASDGVRQACASVSGLQSDSGAADVVLLPAPQTAQSLPAFVATLNDLKTLAPKARCAVLVSMGGLRVIGTEALDPTAAAVQSFALSAAQEVAQIAIHGLDLTPDYAQTGLDAALTLLLQQNAPRRLALRGATLWRFGHLNVPQTDDRVAPISGHVVITGASGPLGQAIAQRLVHAAGKDDLKLTLLARTPPAEAGPHCLALSADVTDRTALTAALKQARARFGPVDHVIHAAGPSAQASYRPMDAGWADDIAAPKWAGFDHLLGALNTDEPRRAGLLISSVSTALGGLGLSSYAAANAGAEALAALAGARWSTLALDGLGAGSGQVTHEMAVNLAHRLLAGPTGDVTYLCATPLAPRLATWVDGTVGSSEPSGDATSAKSPLEGAELEHAIAGLWAELLGGAPPDQSMDFFAAGGDSLVLVQLLPRLTALGGVRLSLADLMSDPTIDGMIGLIKAEQDGLAPAAQPAATEMEEGEL